MFRPGSPTPSTDGAARAASGRESGQPRPEAEISARSPSAAERARTLVEGNASGALDIPGIERAEPGAGLPAARAVLPDGDVVLLMAGDAPAARFAAHAQDDDLAAVLEITDVAPVAVPHRIRGRTWVTGWLTPVRDQERAACAALLARQYPVGEILGLSEAAADDPAPGRRSRPAWTLLRLEVGEVMVDDLWGAEAVEPEEFAAASPDPLARCEAELLQHLAAAHHDQVRALCSLLGGRGPACAARQHRAAPVALDRFGLRVRFTGEDGTFDARFEFPEPVDGHDGLRTAMHALFEAAESEQR